VTAQRTREGWRSRIVGHGEEAPDQLLANPLNFRIHPKAQQDALAGVLNEVGWVQDVIVNQRTGHVIDGHLRVSLAISKEEPTIPVVYVDLEEHEERLILATIDPLSAMAATDATKLDELLREVATGDEAIQAMLDQLAQRSGLVPPIDPMSEWQGMPEFEHEDKTAHQTIHLHFKDADAVEAFARLVERNIMPSTKSLWFPDDGLESIDGARYDDVA
jgi:hypothetical protein